MHNRSTCAISQHCTQVEGEVYQRSSVSRDLESRIWLSSLNFGNFNGRWTVLVPRSTYSPSFRRKCSGKDLENLFSKEIISMFCLLIQAMRGSCFLQCTPSSRFGPLWRRKRSLLAAQLVAYRLLILGHRVHGMTSSRPTRPLIFFQTARCY